MDTKDLISKMRNANTWRELGLTIKEVLEVLIEDEASKPAPSKDAADTIADLYRQIEEKNNTIERLRESVKKLRQENKKARGSQD